MLGVMKNSNIGSKKIVSRICLDIENEVGLR